MDAQQRGRDEVMQMARRMMVGVAVLVLLGIVLLVVGAVIEPARDKVDQTNSKPGLIYENAAVTQEAESLIAFGLTLILVGIGFFLAWMGHTVPATRMGE